jgi:tetratricopeptide (TPR) repeat protein
MTRHPRSHFLAAPSARVDGCLVVALVIVAFLPALFGGFLGWDDDQNFVENPAYRGLDGPHLRWMLTTYHMGHWKPVTWLTHGVDHALWGMHPMGYKAVTILLHALAALALLVLARRLLALALDRAPDGPIRVGALGAALLWALHPLRVEPVAWLSARGDVVAGLGAFVTVLAYLRAHRRPPGADGPGAPAWSPAWYVASLALFALALMGKAIVVTLPVVLLILDVYPLRRLGTAAGGWLGPPARRAYLEKAPFLALSAVASALAVRARIEFGSLVDVGDIGGPLRAASVLYSLAFHLEKSLLPVALSPLYDLRATLARGPWPFVAAGAVVLAITAVVIVRARRWPALAATWAAYVIVLLPVSGVVQNGPQIAADRYAYLAGAAWTLLAGGGLAWCAAEVAAPSSRRPFARCVLALATAACVTLVSLSAWQSLTWQDTLTLWSRVVALEPGNALAHTGLGTALLDEGRRADAAAHYRRALALFPQLPEAEMGLGLILGGEGRPTRPYVTRGRPSRGSRSARVFAWSSPTSCGRGAGARRRSGRSRRESAWRRACHLSLSARHQARADGPRGRRGGRARAGPSAAARRRPTRRRERPLHRPRLCLDRPAHRGRGVAPVRPRDEPDPPTDTT